MLVSMSSCSVKENPDPCTNVYNTCINDKSWNGVGVGSICINDKSLNDVDVGNKRSHGAK